MSNDLPLNEITSDLCHDINNPLAIVCGTSQQLGRLLNEGAVDLTKAKTLLERMDRNLERITRLVHGLAILAKKTQNETPKLIEAHKLLESIGPFCEETLKKAKIDFKVTIPEGMPKLFCRTMGLSQAVLVLIRHACKVEMTSPLPAHKPGDPPAQNTTPKTITLTFSPTASATDHTSGCRIVLRRLKGLDEETATLPLTPAMAFPKEILRLHEGTLTASVDATHTDIILELPTPASAPSADSI